VNKAKTAAAVVVLAISVWGMAGRAQGGGRQGYMKPELRGAVPVTGAMLAPLRLVPQEVWYNALVQDPRHGDYKVGYLLKKLEADGNNLIITEQVRLVMKIYSVDFQSSEFTITETVSMDTGKPLEVVFKGRIAGYAYWFFGVSMPPESSVEMDKKAVYDWNRKKITVTYGNDPKAPVRSYAIENNTVPFCADEIFVYRQLGRQDGKTYHFRRFNLLQEKYEDYYLKYGGTQGKDTHKYSSVPPGWGETMVNSMWFGPPTDAAPNGIFQKIIANPLTDRYTTYLPTTKEDALKPVTPMLE